MKSGATTLGYVELRPGHHVRVHDYCVRSSNAGRAWVPLDDIENGTDAIPAAGAVMALRDAGQLRTRVSPSGQIEIAASVNWP